MLKTQNTTNKNTNSRQPFANFVSSCIVVPFLELQTEICNSVKTILPSPKAEIIQRIHQSIENNEVNSESI